VATLDTLARFVLGAPYTTEPERKKAEGHYPYWWRWREEWVQREGRTPEAAAAGGRRWGIPVWGLVGLALVVAGLAFFFRRTSLPEGFREDFTALAGDSLAARGWMVRDEDTGFWRRRGEEPGCLTLFTLKGDNWPDPDHAPVIRNLLQRRVPCPCFTLELHLKDFVPRQNWQQAGILLSEDTGFGGRSLRVSISYNDYNGVFPRSGTILLQAITSLGETYRKPEEIAHVPLFHMDTLRRMPMLYKDLEHTALRIEKRGDRFRILYADGISENTSFREVVSHEFPMHPRYVGLFALRGFVDSAEALPARIRFFRLDCAECK
jgi:hypothetical protein